jgi:hypothetical protein
VKYFSLICLLAGSLFASVNEPMRWEYSTGYRIDHFHWHLQNGGALAYSEEARNLQFWDNGLALSVIYRDIALFATASYDACGSGELERRFASQPDSPVENSHVDCQAFATWGYFGYSVNLTDGRTYKTILIPFVGFGADGEKIDAPAHEHMGWYGPLFGGAFLAEPGGRLTFEAGYAYHIEYLRFTSLQRIDKLKVKGWANLSHSGWARLDYAISPVWRSSLAARMNYFASRILDAGVKNRAAGQKTKEKFRTRWTAVTGVLTISREF